MIEENEGGALDNLTKALALARIGIKVFPVKRIDRSPAIPYSDGGRGFYDGTTDFELIATWFSLDFVGDEYAVGVWTGGSGLAALDIDRGKSNGKDGFLSLTEAALQSDYPGTVQYPTESGGRHVIWATDNEDLTPQQDATFNGSKLMGVDIRAGGSYIVWWGDYVPADRSEFSDAIPPWVVEASLDTNDFTGEGFTGTIAEWLDSVSSEVLPSGRIADLMRRIPETDFGHSQMVELAWEIVRLGSERENGIVMALEKLQAEWLRGKYDTPKNRHDLKKALQGAINKGGRVQHPIPAMTSLSAAMVKATELGIADDLKTMEASVSETATEIDLARMRKDMFALCASAGLSQSGALGLVAGSKSFKLSKVSMENAWFSDGEPAYHDLISSATASPEEPEEPIATAEQEEFVHITNLAAEAEAFSFLSAAEIELLETDPSYEWWGTEYLAWVKGKLKHFNRPYHVGAMWAALSVIMSPWGKVPLAGAKATDVNLYLNVQGMSTSGKSEAVQFAFGVVDAFFGPDNNPIIADIKKGSALSIHRTLLQRDGRPSMIYSDEVQSFFQDIKKTHWQGSILGDMSDYYGGNVPPKNTMNDKEYSGKRAKTMLTSYFTGIADQTLDAIDINMWTSGMFYRFIWAFGYPRVGGDYSIKMEASAASFTKQFEDWAKEFQRREALQSVMWGEGRLVQWEDDALERMEQFNEDLDKAVRKSALYDSVFVAANGRFLISILKCATIVALSEAAEKVTLRHALIALSYAGPWHRSMVLAVEETGKDAFEREVEKCLAWIQRNAVRQVDKRPYIQRSAVMRAFKPNEVADRLLRQLQEEGWIARAGDMYELLSS